MEMIAGIVAGLVVLYIIFRIMSLPMRLMWKFVTNSVIGAVMLWVVSLVGIKVQISLFTALIAGIFGVPGVIAVIIFSYM